MPHRFFAPLLAVGLALSACASSATTGPSAPFPPALLAVFADAAKLEGPTSATNAMEPRTETEQNAEAPLEERESRQLGRTWGWVAVGVGASAALIALGTSAIMLDDLSRRNAHCGANKLCTSDGMSANDGLLTIAPVNTTSWIVAAAGLGTGAALLIANPTDRSKGLELRVAPMGSGAALAVRGSF